MARFVAIPVTVGDAFFLERRAGSILVDGGMNRNAFPELFRQCTQRTGVDVLVVTHNDSDHTSGIAGFLAAGMPCKEVWLPGRWLGVLPEIARDPNAAVHNIIEQGFDFWVEHNVDFELPPSIQEVGDRLSRNSPEPEECEPAKASEAAGWPDEVVDAFEADESAESTGRRTARGILCALGAHHPSWPLIEQAIQAGNRILEIARLAYYNGIPVRWFIHSPHAPAGGIPGFLEPVTARQVVRVFPRRTLFEELCLSTANIESLVLYSPPDIEAPGVLFSADSDLRAASAPTGAFDIVTTPHHGSHHNAPAYASVLAAVPKHEQKTITWVRSDRRSRSRPCDEYRQLSARRICTVCSTGEPKQRVLLVGRKRRWARARTVRLCQC